MVLSSSTSRLLSFGHTLCDGANITANIFARQLSQDGRFAQKLSLSSLASASREHLLRNIQTNSRCFSNGHVPAVLRTADLGLKNGGHFSVSSGHFKQHSVTVTVSRHCSNLASVSPLTPCVKQIPTSSPLSGLLLPNRMFHGSLGRSANLSPLKPQHGRKTSQSVKLLCDERQPTTRQHYAMSKRFYPGTVQQHALALAVKRPIRKKPRTEEVVC